MVAKQYLKLMNSPSDGTTAQLLKVDTLLGISTVKPSKSFSSVVRGSVRAFALTPSHRRPVEIWDGLPPWESLQKFVRLEMIYETEINVQYNYIFVEMCEIH